MNLWKAIVPGALALGMSTVAWAQASKPAAEPPEARAFDFWIGEWNVTAKGKQVGTNRITREIGGRVLHEHYDTGRGYSGESFNIYDASRGVWHQTWVDTGGLLLVLEGGLRDGKMVMEGETTGADKKVSRQRITWTPNPDGSVRQLWEAQGADGAWTVAFDGLYTKK